MKFAVCTNKNGYVREDLGLDLPAGKVRRITDEQAKHIREIGKKGSVIDCIQVELDDELIRSLRDLPGQEG